MLQNLKKEMPRYKIIPVYEHVKNKIILLKHIESF